MATNTTMTIIANSRTPYSVVMHIANPGADDTPTLTVSKATLLAQLLDGPLKALLTSTPDWQVFNTQSGPFALDDRIRISEIAGGLAAVVAPPITTCVVHFVNSPGNGMEFSITRNSEGLISCDLLLEMRIVHSNER